MELYILNAKTCNLHINDLTKILELLVKDFSSNLSISEIIKQVRIINSIKFKWLKIIKTWDKVQNFQEYKVIFKFK